MEFEVSIDKNLPEIVAENLGELMKKVKSEERVDDVRFEKPSCLSEEGTIRLYKDGERLIEPRYPVEKRGEGYVATRVENKDIHTDPYPYFPF